MTPLYPTDPTPIVLADGAERHLRYSLGSVKRIKDKFGKSFQEIMAHPPEELLPFVLLEGLVEKGNEVNEANIMDGNPALVNGPMIEYVQLQFIEAFFGPRVKDVIAAAAEQTRNTALKAVDSRLSVQ